MGARGIQAARGEEPRAASTVTQTVSPASRRPLLTRVPGRSQTSGSPSPTSARSWPGTGPRWPWWWPFPGVPWGRHALGVPLIVLGAVVSVTAYLEWRRTQTALRRSEPIPQSVLPRILVVTITGVAALSAVVLLVSAVR